MKRLKLTIIIPKRNRGRPSVADAEQFDQQLKHFCAGLLQINSTLDFRVSSRGWCYILEVYGLAKGDFDTAQRLINDCRKNGYLPTNICAEDEGRAAEHLEEIDDKTPAGFAEDWIDYVRTHAHEQYCPVSFWEDLPIYVQMAAEKIDLKSLFSSECQPFHIPLMNLGGWNDINVRVGMMKRFAYWERRGKRIVLLYCGDHDPGGLQISNFLKSNMCDLAGAVDWRPDNLEIDRFGLNYNFIQKHRLTWIDNLITGSGGDLADPSHLDHDKPYVRDYIAQFGARKVEANALVVKPEAGRKLCRDTILKYVPASAITDYGGRLGRTQRQAHREILRLLRGQA